MKQQYRELVLSIQQKEEKLRAAKLLKAEAEEALRKADGYVSFGEASLAASNARLVELESSIFN